MDAMLRRRAMMASGPVVERALYPFPNFTYSASGESVTFTNGVFSMTTSANSRNCYCGKSYRGTSHGASWATIFTLHAGDEWQLDVKDISYTSSTSGSNYCNISLYTKDGASVIGKQVSFGSGTGTKPDLTFTGTIAEDSADLPINSIRFPVYRAVSPISFVLQFRVNGVLYTMY